MALAHLGLLLSPSPAPTNSNTLCFAQLVFTFSGSSKCMLAARMLQSLCTADPVHRVKQQGFELPKSTYMWIFLVVNNTVLLDLWLVNSVDVESQIQRNGRCG